MKFKYLFMLLLPFIEPNFMHATDKSIASSVLNVLEPSVSSEFAASLNNVTSDVFAATLLLCNSFGRLALVGCLGYKAYLLALKTLKNKECRVKYGLKTLCYVGATCMLLTDGYQWVLRRDSGN